MNHDNMNPKKETFKFLQRIYFVRQENLVKLFTRLRKGKVAKRRYSKSSIFKQPFFLTFQMLFVILLVISN